MANHSRAWHDLDEEIRDKMSDAKDAWDSGDHASARELDRVVSNLKDEQKRID